MPRTPTPPGVYIEEIPSGVVSITGVTTSITALIGRAAKGPVDDPVTVPSFGEYDRRFGGLWRESPMSYAVQHFFANSGSEAPIFALVDPAGALAARLAPYLSGADLQARVYLSMQAVLDESGGRDQTNAAVQLELRPVRGISEAYDIKLPTCEVQGSLLVVSLPGLEPILTRTVSRRAPSCGEAEDQVIGIVGEMATSAIADRSDRDFLSWKNHHWRNVMRVFQMVLLVCILATTSAFAVDLESRADAAYSSGDFEAAARLYMQAADCDRHNAGLLYNGACSASLAGRTDDAFALLERAIDAGFSNSNHLREDPDLESLRTDLRWAALIERVAFAEDKLRAFWDSDVLVGEYSERLPEDIRIAGLSKVWSEAKFNFANFDLVPDLDIDALYLDFLPRVRASERTPDYYLVLMEFVAALRDGHSNVYPPREAVDQILARPAIRTRLIEDRVLVIRVDEKSLREVGLVAGLEVVSVDGIPALEYGNTRIRPWQAASTPHDSDVRTFGYNYLAGKAGTVVSLELQDSGGNRSIHQVRRLTRAKRDEISPSRPAFAMHELPGEVLHI
jgi:tetratricopeptide (TPR) repeat protein